MLAVARRPAPDRVAHAARNRLQVFTAEGREPGARPRDPRASAGSCGPRRAGSPRRPIVRSSSSTPAATPPAARPEPRRGHAPGDPPDTFGLALVQERDRVGRATARRPLDLEEGAELAGRRPGHRARRLRRRDDRRRPARRSSTRPASRRASYSADPSEPLCLIEAPDGSPPPVAWLTPGPRARRCSAATTSRGRSSGKRRCPGKAGNSTGSGRWPSSPRPTAAPSPTTARGTSAARAAPTDGGTELFGTEPAGEPWRVTRQGVHLICADLDGRVRWRRVADEPLGPFAVGRRASPP